MSENFKAFKIFKFLIDFMNNDITKTNCVINKHPSDL